MEFKSNYGPSHNEQNHDSVTIEQGQMNVGPNHIASVKKENLKKTINEYITATQNQYDLFLHKVSSLLETADNLKEIMVAMCFAVESDHFVNEQQMLLSDSMPHKIINLNKRYGAIRRKLTSESLSEMKLTFETLSEVIYAVIESYTNMIMADDEFKIKYTQFHKECVNLFKIFKLKCNKNTVNTKSNKCNYNLRHNNSVITHNGLMTNDKQNNNANNVVTVDTVDTAGTLFASINLNQTHNDTSLHNATSLHNVNTTTTAAKEQKTKKQKRSSKMTKNNIANGNAKKSEISKEDPFTAIMYKELKRKKMASASSVIHTAMNCQEKNKNFVTALLTGRDFLLSRAGFLFGITDAEHITCGNVHNVVRKYLRTCNGNLGKTRASTYKSRSGSGSNNLGLTSNYEKIDWTEWSSSTHFNMHIGTMMFTMTLLYSSLIDMMLNKDELPFSTNEQLFNIKFILSNSN